jgi:hypothetical protein
MNAEILAKLVELQAAVDAKNTAAIQASLAAADAQKYLDEFKKANAEAMAELRAMMVVGKGKRKPGRPRGSRKAKAEAAPQPTA